MLNIINQKKCKLNHSGDCYAHIILRLNIKLENQMPQKTDCHFSMLMRKDSLFLCENMYLRK